MLTWEVTAYYYNDEGEHAPSVIVTTADYHPEDPESSRDMVPPHLLTWATEVWAPSSRPQGCGAARITFAHHRPAYIGAAGGGQGAVSVVVHDTWDTHHFNQLPAGDF